MGKVFLLRLDRAGENYRFAEDFWPEPCFKDFGWTWPMQGLLDLCAVLPQLPTSL